MIFTSQIGPLLGIDEIVVGRASECWWLKAAFVISSSSSYYFFFRDTLLHGKAPLTFTSCFSRSKNRSDDPESRMKGERAHCSRKLLLSAYLAVNCCSSFTCESFFSLFVYFFLSCHYGWRGFSDVLYSHWPASFDIENRGEAFINKPVALIVTTFVFHFL